MSKFLEIYNGNPTAGDVDGTPVSEGTFTNPVGIIIDVGETGYVKLAARCRDGFHADGDLTITRKYKQENDEGTTYEDAGGNLERFSLLADDGYTDDTIKSAEGWNPSITLSGLANVNKIFWLRCASETGDSTASDRTICLEVKAPIKADTEDAS